MVAIEVEPLQSQTNIFNIDEIQSPIELQGQKYELFGVINYIPRNEHFVGYAQRKNKKWEKFDDLHHKSTPEIDPKLEKVNPFMLFYVKE